MIAADSLIRSARDYELLSASCAERAELPAGAGAGQREAAAAFILAAIVLREVAAALSEDWL
jgi:hypothetical protein